MAQVINVRVPLEDSERFKAISTNRSVSYSQLFTDYFTKIAKNPLELGQIVVQRILDKVEPKDKQVSMMNLYLGRDNFKKFIEISDATLINRAALATLIIQSIIQQEKQAV